MKFPIDDRTYHHERAEAELRLAEASPDPSIGMVHRELAALHRRRMLSIIEESVPPPLLRSSQGRVQPRRQARPITAMTSG